MLSKHKIKQFIKECESATFTIADLDQLYETEEAMCLAKMFLESRIEEDIFIRRLAKSCGCPHDGTCLCFEDGEELRRLHFIIQKELIDGEIYFLAGVQDITDEYKRQNELIKANDSLNLLIKESNHRIKNNLNILLRYISLEKRLNKDNLAEVINKMEFRIKSLDLFHNLLYTGPSSDEVLIMEYFKNFAITLTDVYPTYDDIVFTSEDDSDFMVSADKIVPLSLITNELLTNSIKHAYVDFPINRKMIHGAIYKKDNCCEILYRDNGIGVPDDFNPKETSGLGWVIINALVDQLKGKYEVYKDDGMCFRLTFPLD